MTQRAFPSHASASNLTLPKNIPPNNQTNETQHAPGRKIKKSRPTNRTNKLNNTNHRTACSGKINQSNIVVVVGRRPSNNQTRTCAKKGVRMGRRRAVDASDHKTCVLLHSRLKGMKLEDVA